MRIVVIQEDGVDQFRRGVGGNKFLVVGKVGFFENCVFFLRFGVIFYIGLVIEVYWDLGKLKCLGCFGQDWNYVEWMGWLCRLD